VLVVVLLSVLTPHAHAHDQVIEKRKEQQEAAMVEAEREEERRRMQVGT
jgi:hypothetical protein